MVQNLPRKDKISKCKSIPRSVLENPILTTSVVDKYHHSNANAVDKKVSISTLENASDAWIYVTSKWVWL